jgi:hypothetical protein
MIVISQYGWLQMLLNSQAPVVTPGLAGVWVGAQLTLYTNNITPNEQTPLSAFTLAGDTITAPQTVVFGAAAYRQAGGVLIQAALLRFVLLSDSDPSITIQGFVLTDSATPANLLASEAAPAGGITLMNINDLVEIGVQVALGGPDNGNAFWNY